MLRFRKKSLEESVAALRVPEHSDPANKADADLLISVVQKQFSDIQAAMRQLPPNFQEVSVLTHIRSISFAAIKYGTDVATRETMRYLDRTSKIDSAREGRLAKRLIADVEGIAERLDKHYNKLFDERKST